MARLLVLFGASLGGGAGWWLGERFDLTAAVLLSAVGTGAGVYAAIRVNREMTR